MPKMVDQVDSIRHQPAVLDKGTLKIDGGQTVPCCQRNNDIPINQSASAPCHDHAAVGHACKLGNSALNLSGIESSDGAQFDSH